MAKTNFHMAAVRHLSPLQAYMALYKFAYYYHYLEFLNISYLVT